MQSFTKTAFINSFKINQIRTTHSVFIAHSISKLGCDKKKESVLI